MRLTSETIREIRIGLMGKISVEYRAWIRALKWDHAKTQDWLEQVSVDGVMRCMDDIEQWDPEVSDFNHWCWLRTRTLARDQLRVFTRRQEIKEEFVREAAAEPYYVDSIDRFIQQAGDREELKNAFLVLNETQKQVFALRYISHLKVSRISTVMGIKSKTIYTLLDRARKKLKEAIEKNRELESLAEYKLLRSVESKSDKRSRPPPTSSPLPPQHMRRASP